ncbi:hypothetical protein MASR2M12_09200 [Bacteroidales bacterium]
MVPLNQSVKFGLITGMALIAYTVVLYVTDMNLFSPTFAVLNGIISFGLILFMLTFTIHKTRDLELGGTIKFQQAFVAGFVMALITMYLNSLFGYLLNGIIDPGYMPRQLDHFAETMEGKISEEQLEQILDNVRDNADSLKGFVRSLWISPITAAFLSAVVSLFVKKNPSAQNSL